MSNIIRINTTRKTTINSDDVVIVDALAKLLHARGGLRRTLNDIDEAESNAKDAPDFDFTIKVHKLRREAIMLWQEIDNAIMNLV